MGGGIVCVFLIVFLYIYIYIYSVPWDFMLLHIHARVLLCLLEPVHYPILQILAAYVARAWTHMMYTNQCGVRTALVYERSCFVHAV